MSGAAARTGNLDKKQIKNRGNKRHVEWNRQIRTGNECGKYEVKERKWLAG